MRGALAEDPAGCSCDASSFITLANGELVSPGDTPARGVALRD